MVAITEQYIFTKPFLDDDQTNRHHQLLNEEARSLRGNKEARLRAEELKKTFTDDHQCLCHGDLHTGSIMIKDGHAKVHTQSSSLKLETSKAK